MARSVPSIVSSNSNPRVFPSKPLAPMASLPSAPGRLSKTLAIPKSLHGLRKDFQPRSLSNELPLAGNLALDFEAEAVFDQEFSKALQYVQENPDEVCPAGWKPGERSMKPDPKLSKEYFAAI